LTSLTTARGKFASSSPASKRSKSTNRSPHLGTSILHSISSATTCYPTKSATTAA
jgi:hypothetical protein